MIKYLREDNETNASIEAMLNMEESEDNPYLGIFWYDRKRNELFGVEKRLAEDIPYYHSPTFDCNVKTISKLHETVWQKNHYRGKDKRFIGDYKNTPRGRVYQIEDSFVVFTGKWIDNYPEAKEEILFEFNLPKNTEFRQDYHWNIGHGLSQEVI